jgi:hypothetical protein
VSEWVTLLELCEAAGVRIHVTTHNRTYDPANHRDRRSMLEDAVDSEYESGKTSERTTRSNGSRAAAGQVHGRIPYGYTRRYDPTTRRLVAQDPEPDEARVVAELFHRIVGGHSLRAIAADFEARGVRTRSGRVFSPQHLRSLAVNHTYAGLRVHDPNRGPNRTKLTDGAQITDGVWPALVDRATFLAVQRVLNAPERKTTRPGRARHLLSMIAKCAVCGGPLSARSRPGGVEYQCHEGGHVRVDYADLNDYATRAMLGYLARPDNADWLTRGDDDADLIAAREQVAGIRAELDDLADRVGAGKLSATLAARAEPGILNRLRDAERREADLSSPSVLRGLIAPGVDVARRWKAAEMSTRREVARLLLAPDLLGELRVLRSPSRGHRAPIKDRVEWAREPRQPE